MVRQLLADGDSPLYDTRCADELPERLDPPARAGAAPLMVELLGIVIAILCFAGAFALVYLLDRV